MEDSVKPEPVIFDYDNYRQFLKDLYASRKAKKPSYSFRFLARAAGFSSPNFFKLLMEGSRNLAAETIGRVAQALKLNKEETNFFRHLVLLNQAKTHEERQEHIKQLMRSRSFQKLHPLAQHQFDYWAKWHNIPIREIILLAGFREDPAWIGDKLIPKISAQEVEDALQNLMDLQLIKRDAAGRLMQNEVNVFSGDQVTSAAVVQFHREMIAKGRESLERFTGKERHISALTLGLSAEKVEKIRHKIDEFRKELVALAEEDRHSTKIFQINFQFFPLTEEIEESHEPIRRRPQKN